MPEDRGSLRSRTASLEGKELSDYSSSASNLSPQAESSALLKRSGPQTSSDHSVIVWGTGAARREFLHVDDLADACLVIMEKWEDPEHINVGAGKDLTIGELAETVKDIVFPEAELVFDKSKPDGTPQKLLDLSRLSNLGWQPKISFSKGIKETYTWYLSQTQ